MEKVLSSYYRRYYPTSLEDTITTKYEDPYVYEYKLPDVVDEYVYDQPHYVREHSNFPLKYPCRISMPIEKIPDALIGVFNQINPLTTDRLRTSEIQIIKSITKARSVNEDLKDINFYYIQHDPNQWSKIASMSMGYLNKMPSMITNKIMMKFLYKELQITSQIKEIKSIKFNQLPDIPFFVVLMRLFNNHIPLLDKKIRHKEIISESLMEYIEYIKYENQSYVLKYHFQNEYIIMEFYSKWVLITISDRQTTYVFSKTELDYMLTLSETNFNLSFIKQFSEYNWTSDIIDQIIDLSAYKGDHNMKVEFMKNFESLCLQAIDTDYGAFFSWTPVIETVSAMCEIADKLFSEENDIGLILCLLNGQQISNIKTTFFERLVNNIMKLSIYQRAEISSLHKCCFYAIIDIKQGFNKFAKRVHTARNVEDDVIERMCARFTKTLILQYIKRNNHCPNMTGNLNKIAQITEAFRTNDLFTIEAMNLMWWADVYAFNCIDSDLTSDPIEFAKDKGSVSNYIRFGKGDSSRELMDVIKNNTNYDHKFDMSEFKPLPKQVIRIIRQKHDPEYVAYPSRLIPKEREQKVEARLFGAAATIPKHKLSYCMLMAKKVLSYFDSQFMTPSDRKRKTKFHEAAQLLNHPEMYSLLTDIEGHNQSMQPRNTSQLLRLIGLACGQEDWQYLSHYFANLTIYTYTSYEDYAIVSQGQLGGIEGWFNPVWGLHTTLMMKDFFETYSIDCKFLAVYSDDVAAIIRLVNLNIHGLNDLYRKLVAHCYKFGMIVKASQTMISKCRITMLRQHYVLGKRSDASLKRMIATSLFSNENISSEELDVASINSTISSSIELSNYVITATALKLHKAIFVTMRSFAIHFEEKARNSWLTPDVLGEKLYYKIWPNLINHDMRTARERQTHVEFLARDVFSQWEQLPRHTVSDYQNFLNIQYQKISIDHMVRIRIRDLIYLELMENDRLSELFFMLLYFPVQLGGYGLTLLSMQSVTGYSDNILCLLSEFKFYADKLSDHSQIIYHAMEHILGCNYPSVKETDVTPNMKIEMILKDRAYHKEYNVTDIITSNWPNFNFSKSANTHIKSAIQSVFSQNCLNTRIKHYLELRKGQKNYLHNLVSLNLSNFSHRLCSFYLDHSVFHIIDKLINKVENTVSFLRSYKKHAQLRERVRSQNLSNIIDFFSIKDQTFGEINIDTAMSSYMFNRRERMYPQIKFVDIVEPQTSECFELSADNGLFGRVMIKSVEQYKDGVLSYGEPKFGSEALYKGDVKNRDFVYKSIEERLIIENVVITKWILHKSQMASTNLLNSTRSTIIKMSNLTLNTICKYNYQELSEHVPISPGGEIAHRLSDRSFKQFASIRTLPFDTQRYQIYIMQNYVNQMNWVDSNLHFDYVRLKFIFMMTMRYLHTSENLVINYIQPTYTDCITDVRINYDFETDANIPTVYRTWKYDPNESQFIQRLIGLSSVPSLFDNETDIDDIVENNANVTTTNQINDYIYIYAYQFYNSLRKDKIIIDIGNFDPIQWQPFLTKYRIFVPTWVGLSDDQILQEIKFQIIDEKSKRFKELANSNEHISIQLLKEDIRLRMKNSPWDLLELDDAINSLFDQWSSCTKLEKNSLALQFVATYRLNMNELLDNQLISFYKECIVNLCGIFHYENYNINLNRSLTIDRFVVAIEDPGMFDINNSTLLKLQILGRFQKGDFLNRRLFDIACNEIEELIVSLKMSDYIIPNSVTKSDTVHLADTDTVNLDLLKKFTVTMLDVGEEVFEENNKLNKLIKYRSEACQLYSHPDIYTSDTGSDTFMIAYALLHGLLTNNLISTDQIVVDAVAGRGDFHRALSLLAIDHTSHVIQDTYTSIYSTEGLILYENYDITTPATCAWLSSGDICLLDIHHSRSGSQDLTNTVYDMISAKQTIIIRLNHVTLSKNTLSKLSNYGHLDMKLIHLTDGAFAHPNVYLVIRDTPKSVSLKANTLRLSSWYIPFIKSIFGLIQHDNLLLTSRSKVMNSATILIKNIDFDETFWEDLINKEVNLKSKNLVNKILQDISSINEFIFLTNWMNKKNLEIYKSDIDQFNHIDKFDLLDNRVTYVGDKTAPNYIRHEKNLSLLYQDSPDVLEFNPFTIDNELLFEIGKIHPVYIIRRFCLSLHQIRDSNPLAFTGIISKDITILKNFNENLNVSTDALSDLYRECICYIVYCTQSKGENQYLKYITRKLANNHISFNHFKRLIVLSKKLSGYSEFIVRKFKSSRDQVTLIPKLRMIVEKHDDRLDVKTDRTRSTKESQFIDHLEPVISDEVFLSMFENMIQNLSDSPLLRSRSILDDLPNEQATENLKTDKILGNALNQLVNELKLSDLIDFDDLKKQEDERRAKMTQEERDLDDLMKAYDIVPADYPEDYE